MFEIQNPPILHNYMSAIKTLQVPNRLKVFNFPIMQVNICRNSGLFCACRSQKAGGLHLPSRLLVIPFRTYSFVYDSVINKSWVAYRCNYWFFDVNYSATTDGLCRAFLYKETRCFAGRVRPAIGSGLWSVCCVLVRNRRRGLSPFYISKWVTPLNAKILMQERK